MATPATQCDRAMRANQRRSALRLALTSIVTFLPMVCPPAFAATSPHKPGLGVTLTTADGGEIFGFDIDQNGSDGVLASSQDVNDNEIGRAHV